LYELKLKRIYEPAAPEDGYRVLVDRLWPRGVSKERAALDDWAKDLAPSPTLRKDFCHIPERMADFTVRYSMELDQSAFADGYAAHLLSLLSEKPVTLLYGARDPVVNHAVVLKAWLEKWMEGNAAGGKR
jgi:ribokinase